MYLLRSFVDINLIARNSWPSPNRRIHGTAPGRLPSAAFRRAQN